MPAWHIKTQGLQKLDFQCLITLSRRNLLSFLFSICNWQLRLSPTCFWGELIIFEEKWKINDSLLSFSFFRRPFFSTSFSLFLPFVSWGKIFACLIDFSHELNHFTYILSSLYPKIVHWKKYPMLNIQNVRCCLMKIFNIQCQPLHILYLKANIIYRLTQHSITNNTFWCILSVKVTWLDIQCIESDQLSLSIRKTAWG